MGLGRPARGWWHWMSDLHFMLAVLAAVPVWLAFGALAGDRLQVNFAVYALISLLLVQPAVEEVVFRGALQGSLLAHGWHRHIGPVSIANLVTTAAFAVLHLPAQPPLWALGVAAPSLVFGHVRERFDSVLPAVVLHSIYNAGFAATAFCVQR